MANQNAPFGFRPTMRTVQGGRCQIIPAHKLVGDGTALFTHDAVNQAASGVKPTRCIKAAAGPATSVVLGVNLVPGDATKLTDHNIVLAHGAMFVVQGDGSGATFLVAASLNLNANIVFTAGDAVSKRSKHSLGETSLASTNTLDLKVRGLYESPDNVAGQYAKVFCSFNNCVDADQKAGI